MTGSDIASILTALGLLVTALTSAASLMVSVGNSRKANKIAADVAVIHTATNSMQTALVAAESKVATAEGTAAGIVTGHAAGLEQGRNEERK